jgi:hypothetical protein
MARRLLHLIALVVLVLAGPAQGMFAPAPPPTCCCGEADTPGQDRGPCGMPKGPCAPRCPTGAAQATLAPAVTVTAVQAAQKRRAAPRRESAPWPSTYAVRLPAAPAPANLFRGPPPLRFRDPQAGFSQFRI